MHVWVFFGFICACYFCICVSFATPAIFRNPRLLHFARCDVIFACVFVYFVTLTLGANARLGFFFPPMRMLFLQKLEFCDERVISKTTHKSSCTIRRNCFLHNRVFFNTNVWCKCTSGFFLGSYARVISAYA